MNGMGQKAGRGEMAGSLEHLIDRIGKEYSARGIAVGVVDAWGSILYENYVGWRDEERRLPINRDTIFGLASISKSFTALSILQLQKEGVLSVDDPIRDLIPEFTNRNQPELVRIWHLLCHSGGYFPLPRIVVDKTAREMGIADSLDNELAEREDFAEEGARRVAERLDRQTRFTGRPGQRMSYCNDGFGLLSDIVRRYSGSGSFAAYLKHRIFEPLGMERSNISFLRNSLDPNAAVLYTLENGVWRADHDYENDAFVLHGGGGVKSTLGDMLKYVAMYLREGVSGRGERIIDRYSLGEMWRPRQLVKPGVFYCYGLETRQLRDMVVLEHGGSLPGVSSHMAFCPQKGVGAVVLCNTMDVPVFAIAHGALRLFAGLPMEETRFCHAPRWWTGKEIRELAGDYVSGEGSRFCLRPEGEWGLSMELDGRPVDMRPVYPWQGMVRNRYGDVYLTAIRDEDGTVFGARYGSRIFPKLQKSIDN